MKKVWQCFSCWNSEKIVMNRHLYSFVRTTKNSVCLYRNSDTYPILRQQNPFIFFFNCTLRVSQAALLPPKTMRQSDGTVCRFCLAFCPHSAHHTPISLASSDIWSLDAHLTIWSLLLPLLHYLILSQSQDILWDNAIFSQAHCVS